MEISLIVTKAVQLIIMVSFLPTNPSFSPCTFCLPVLALALAFWNMYKRSWLQSKEGPGLAPGDLGVPVGQVNGSLGEVFSDSIWMSFYAGV